MRSKRRPGGGRSPVWRAIRRYSDTLMIALLKARRPEKFKDRQVVEHDIADGLADRLEAARRRALAASSEGATVASLPAVPARLVRDGRG